MPTSKDVSKTIVDVMLLYVDLRTARRMVADIQRNISTTNLSVLESFRRVRKELETRPHEQLLSTKHTV
jgi:hypothetical protein